MCSVSEAGGSGIAASAWVKVFQAVAGDNPLFESLPFCASTYQSPARAEASTRTVARRTKANFERRMGPPSSGAAGREQPRGTRSSTGGLYSGLGILDRAGSKMTPVSARERSAGVVERRRALDRFHPVSSPSAMPEPTPFLIATRGSRLALWQATRTRELLLAARPDKPVELLTVESGGDADPRSDLARFGRTGIFTAEIDQAILSGRAPCGVPSPKDMTTSLPEGLVLAGTLARGPIEDVLGSRAGKHPADLPPGARD